MLVAILLFVLFLLFVIPCRMAECCDAVVVIVSAVAVLVFVSSLFIIVAVAPVLFVADFLARSVNGEASVHHFALVVVSLLSND